MRCNLFRKRKVANASFESMNSIYMVLKLYIKLFLKIQFYSQMTCIDKKMVNLSSVAIYCFPRR
jgi:hypothetical protein